MSRSRVIGVFAAGGAIALGLTFAPFVPKTTGVSNIEDRFTSGGGSPDHTPGSASPVGNSDQVHGNMEKQQGYGNEQFKKDVAGQTSSTKVSTRH